MIIVKQCKKQQQEHGVNINVMPFVEKYMSFFWLLKIFMILTSWDPQKCWNKSHKPKLQLDMNITERMVEVFCQMLVRVGKTHFTNIKSN